MQIGVTMFPTDYSMGPAEFAQAAEERGFDLVLFPEHSHIPASRESPFPGGGELPRHYSHTYDPFVGLAAAAMVTKRILLGTGVCLLVERDPIHTAKEVASVDRLSGGRFVFGVGGGWNVEEMANHGMDAKRRWKALRERVEAMKALWTQEEATYRGEFISFERAWQWPKPVQQPHPPVLVGGDGERTLERVVRYGDEWMPNMRATPQRVAEHKPELDRLAKEAGRGPIPVSIYGCRPEADMAKAYADAGVSRVTFMLPSEPAEQVLPLMDQALAVGRKVAG